LLENILDYQKFILSNITTNILVGKRKDSIIIKTDEFKIELNIKELSSLFNNVFNNLNEAYSYIINLFELNKIFPEPINNESLTLIISEKEINIKIILKKIDTNKQSNSIESKKESDIKLLNLSYLFK
jgi:hypothetical protein